MRLYPERDSSRCYATIDLDRLTENFRVLKRTAGNKGLMAVVKADAYGHGAIEVALALKNLAEMFAVSTAEEAFELREAGIENELLVLGYVPPGQLKALSMQNVIITVYDEEYAVKQSEIACGEGFILRAHLKINSGMNRLGISVKNETAMLRLIALKGLAVEGIFTHFASADGESEEDVEFTKQQHNSFINRVESLKKKGFNPKYIHSENTAGTAYCMFKESNLVRCGIGLYGYPPGDAAVEGLKPVMQLYARVAQCRTLKQGEAISYGRTFVAEKDMRVAVITAGYADGYTRLLSGKGIVEVSGRAARVIGRVCMDYLFIDISDINNVSIGDDVKLLGDSPAIDAAEAAQLCGKISYELLCGISTRVIRIYNKE